MAVLNPEERVSAVGFVNPGWNVEDSLIETLDRHARTYEASGNRSEIVVEVEGARARNADVATGSGHLHVPVLRLEGKLRDGETVLAGLPVSGYQNLGYLDEGGHTLPERPYSLVYYLIDADCLHLNCLKRDASGPEGEPLLNLSAGYTRETSVRSLLNLLLRTPESLTKSFTMLVPQLLANCVLLTIQSLDVDLPHHGNEGDKNVEKVPAQGPHCHAGLMLIDKAISAKFDPPGEGCFTVFTVAKCASPTLTAPFYEVSGGNQPLMQFSKGQFLAPDLDAAVPLELLYAG